MVDFDKLRTKKLKPKALDPLEIFRRLPKPAGINDLYTSQAEVLQAWFHNRNDRDVVLKLHTGGGKTLVGLLMAQSTLNECTEPVLYLTPTQQLVAQTLEKAKAIGIPAVPYRSGQPLNDDFVNAQAVMVATYKALFNGLSKFGVRGRGQPHKAAAVILDDAHVAFSVVRESFTLQVSSTEHRERFESLAGLFRRAFKDTNRLGTFDDVLAGSDFAIIEVPYWAWLEQLDAVREQLKSEADTHALVWPLLRDHLHLCHALISRKAFTISSILPLVNAFPTFSEASRRIYMSATIADDSEIVRTFDADPKAISGALTSRSLAGVSERMILIPDLMPFKFKAREAVEKLVAWAAEKRHVGAVILVPSDKAGEQWTTVATVAKGSRDAEALIKALQSGATFGPAAFANRYDGIDLPGDSCRLLVMDALPSGSSDYERFRASALYGGTTITRMLAQRIEQGIGRGARGAGDFCVVLLMGSDLAAWVAKDANFKFLTSATRAQLEMGAEVSREVQNLKDLAKTIERSFNRDDGWVQYHAETLAELVVDDGADDTHIAQAAAERKAYNLWYDGYHDQAIAKIEKSLAELTTLDQQTRGWMEQFAARMADSWGNSERAEDLQRQAYSHNRNLQRPKVLPPYRPMAAPSGQERAIAKQIAEYRLRRGFLQRFEDAVAHLHHESSPNQFEQGLAELGVMLGFSAERRDVNGVGPDVLWLLPSRVGLVIEAKSRKQVKNALTKDQHGQLLVAAEWFAANYQGYTCVRVSVHPKNRATQAAAAGASHALTYEKLAAMVSDARALLTKLAESQLSGSALAAETGRLLATSALKSERIVKSYFEPFQDQG